MPKEIAWQRWSELINNGTPDQIVGFLWARIAEHGTLLAFINMLWTFTFRFLLVSFYFSLLYVGIAFIKKRLYKKMSVRVNYYCWYLLFFSVVLANLWFNNGFMALSSRLSVDPELYMHPIVPYVCFTLCLFTVVWLILVICKLLLLMQMNRKIKHSFKQMERYDDLEDLADQAALMLGLRKMPDIWITDYIDTPVSYGIIKKVILLPVDYEEKYSPNELYLLLLHEMTHIKHGDTVKLYLISILGCFLWLTPMMRMFTRSFKQDAELLCDNHVIGLHEKERDVYGNLILKECAYKNTRFGFGFSDSYLVVEKRLDALYRYKGNGTLKLLVFIPAMFLIVCALSFAFRTEWLVVNNRYNSEYIVEVLEPDSGVYISLPREVSAKLCEITHNTRDYCIFLKEDILRTVAGEYACDGIITARVISNNYTVKAGRTGVSSGYLHDYKVDILPPEEDALIISAGGRMKERSLGEYIFLWITSKM